MEIKSFKKQTAEVADEVLRFQEITYKRLEQQVEVNKHLLDYVNENREVIIKLINKVNKLEERLEKLEPNGEENKKINKHLN